MTHPTLRRLAGIGLLVASLVAALFLVLRDSENTEIVVEVPPGTMQRIEAGERVELLPSILEMAVGDRLVIVNQDDATHQVGPYIVGPGQRLEQRFTTPGRIEGVCTLHPSGQVAIVVQG